MMNKKLKTALLILLASAIIIGAFIIWGLLLMDSDDKEVCNSFLRSTI